ncbi:uncharacterized protein LOC132747986 [Ruditapes philippinarum]|uniref:uncharacterized protein LOC132747986 n=1 Tax=Ruditapes philippinarum TaxID=129788 RepID=UPI00295BF7B4|nr:uncharacterized protein LOC132747986 [Ruditapes philippinarum]
MVDTLYCTRILPSRQYFPWYYKIKRQLNDIQQRYVDLHEKIYLKSPVTPTEDNCFTVCRQRTRWSTVFNTSIENEFVPNAENLKLQTFTTDETFNEVNTGDVLVIPFKTAMPLLKHNIDRQIIIVVTDTKENRDASELIQNLRCVKVSYLQNLKKVASLTLEESMFKPMRSYAERLDSFLHNNRKHRSEKDTEMFHHCKDSAERVFFEIIGLFNRSRLNEDHKPEVTGTHQHKVDDKVLKELYRVCPNVKSCGYRYSTLQVFVNDMSNEKSYNRLIENVLKAHGINDFKIVPAICTYQSFLGVGAKVLPTGDVNRYGSLGGFAKKNSHDMCALISRHVAIQSQDMQVSLTSDDGSIQSKIIPETVPIDFPGPQLDISATEILASDVSRCDTKFRSEEGIRMTGKDCIYDETHLSSRRVHIWGAVSTPGLGIITMPEIHDINEDNAYLIVENRANSTTVMSKKGDSGAMVCADDDYGSGVEVISMLIGEDTKNPGKYATLRIDKGLKQLEKQTDSSFRLCKD